MMCPLRYIPCGSCCTAADCRRTLAFHPGVAGGWQEPRRDHRRVIRQVCNVRLPGRSDQSAGSDGALPGGDQGDGEVLGRTEAAKEAGARKRRVVGE